MPPLPGQENPLRRVANAVEALVAHPDSGPFREPVDWRGLELWDYPQIVTKMMDLGTIQRKLDRGQYLTAAQCASDVRLVWSNCMTYNAEGSDFYILAKSLSRKFEDRYRKVRRDYDCGPEDPDNEGGGDNEDYRYGYDDDENEGTGNVDDNKSSYSNQSASVDENATTAALDVKAQLSSLMLLLNGTDLGVVMDILERQCPQALESLADTGNNKNNKNKKKDNNQNQSVPEQCAIDVSALNEDLLKQITDFALERTMQKKKELESNEQQDGASGGTKKKRKR